MGISVCIASGKDGVGKSTIAVNLGIALSGMNISTLMIDADIAGASFGFILGLSSDSHTLHDCLAGRVFCDEALIDAYGAKAIVGGIQMHQLVNVSLDGFPKIIEQLQDKFEIILVDSPAGLGNDAISAISSCESSILVMTPDINSVTNTLKTLAIAKKVGSTALGLIINRKGGSYDIPSARISELMKMRILAEIDETERIKQSLHDAVPTYVEDNSCTFSQDIKSIADKLVGG